MCYLLKQSLRIFFNSSWPASQVVGEPDVYPLYGDIAGSWAQDLSSASWPNEYIEVLYLKNIFYHHQQKLIRSYLEVEYNFQAHNNTSVLMQVQFVNKIYLEQLDIYETFHGGAVVSVSAYDESGQMHVLWSTSQPSNIESSRIFSPSFTVSSYLLFDFKGIIKITSRKCCLVLSIVKVF